MNFVRKVALILITPLFSLFLFALAFDTGILSVVGQSTEVKQILRDSGVYDTAVNSLLSQAKTEVSDGNSVNLQNATIKSAANATFTPQYIQDQTEGVIDSVYAWLNGKTAQPDFNIDLSSLKDKFAANVSQAAESQAAKLPACTDAASIEAASNDPLSATCLPPGVTPAAVGSKVKGDLVAGQGFLDNPTITANNIKSNNSSTSSNGQDVFQDQLKSAPKQYQRVKKTPIILSALALLTAVAIVFLNKNRRKGLRHVGVVLALIGAFMLLFAWGLSQAIDKQVPKIKLNNAVVQSDVHKVLSELGQKIDHNYWIFGVVYLVLGALALLAERFWPGARGGANKDDLEGEGRSAADRIDLKAPDKPMNIGGGASPAAKKPPAKKLGA